MGLAVGRRGGLRWARWHWWRGAAARTRDGVAAAVVTRTERLAMDAAELGGLAGGREEGRKGENEKV